MAMPSEKFSKSSEILYRLQLRGAVALQSADLGRVHRERLRQHGFLKEVIKGWYISSLPDEVAGESTAWYAAFWKFCVVYLSHLKGDDWCLSPEQSLLLHVGNWTVPRQLLVRATKARNNITKLPCDTSLFVVRAAIPDAAQLEKLEEVQVFSLPAALIACTVEFFRKNNTDARLALNMIRDSSELLNLLLAGGHSTVAGRLAAAFRNINKNHIADEIVGAMKLAGYTIREKDPFTCVSPAFLNQRERSPYINRIRLMWEEMREPIIEKFPKAPGIAKNTDAYLKAVEAIYVTDAYHSLSIEGYKVTPELIERVRSGQWNSEKNTDDNENRNALAARGYWQAYQAVRQSIQQVITGSNSGLIAEKDHRVWYQEMFASGVVAGLLKPTDLAGYRNGQVYIRKSMHVPFNYSAVRDVMPVFFKLLQEEQEASVRVVLGHFTLCAVRHRHSCR